MRRNFLSKFIGSPLSALRVALAVGAFSLSAAQAQMQINIVQPATGGIASGHLYVQAAVSSVIELSSVTAQVEGQQVNLKYSQPLNAWTNSVSLAGLSYGQRTLTVTATDFFGGTAQAFRFFQIDNPPMLLVRAPLNDTVVGGEVFVEATALDDGPIPPVIRVHSPYNMGRPNQGVVLIGTNTVQGYINAMSVRSADLVFEVIDSAGQTRFIPRRVWKESSSNLVEIGVAPGKILDTAYSRILYTEQKDLPVAYPDRYPDWSYGVAQPRILEQDTGHVLTAGESTSAGGIGLPDPVLGIGFVGSSGALLGTLPRGLLYGSLSHWSGSNILSLGPFSGGGDDVYRAGNTFAWRWDQPNGPDQVTLMDLNDTNRLFTLSIPYVEGTSVATIAGFHLAPNFDLVYSISNHVFRSRPASTEDPYSNRATTQLTGGAGGASGGVATDGTNVAYTRSSDLMLITPAGEELLASPSAGSFKLNNGWTAYTKPGISGQMQVWTRSPAGAQQQRTFFNTSSALESLGPNGEVTFLNNNARYICLPGVVQPVWVNSGQGRVRWDDGRLRVVLGRSVLEFRMGQLQCIALAGGSSRLTFNGPTGFSYTVQYSSDLEHWTDLWTFTHTTGSVSWTNPPTSAHKFYRAVTAPMP